MGKLWRIIHDPESGESIPIRQALVTPNVSFLAGQASPCGPCMCSTSEHFNDNDSNDEEWPIHLSVPSSPKSKCDLGLNYTSSKLTIMQIVRLSAFQTGGAEGRDD